MERDNWENSAIDDFYRRQAEVCRYCGDDKEDDDNDTCAQCRAQPARLTDVD